MMYLSKVSGEPDRTCLCVILPPDFVSSLDELDRSLRSIPKLRSASREVPVELARLFEDGEHNDPEAIRWTGGDRGNGECPLGYYGFDISRHWAPGPDFQYGEKFEEVELWWTASSFGFSAKRKGVKDVLHGNGISVDDWRRWLS